MTTKAQQTKAISEAVNAYFNNGVSLDDTALILTQNGVAFTAIQDTIKKIGVEKGWYLTPEKIQEKVTEALKGKVLTHFLDVVNLAKQIDLAQLSDQEKHQAIIEYSGVAKSVVKESRKFKQFHNSGHFGNLTAWVLEHPNFTPEQIHNSGTCASAPNASDYYEEMLAYRELMREVFKRQEAEKQADSDK